MADTSAFLGSTNAPLDQARFSIIPAPLEASVTYLTGQALAPERILEASTHLEPYDDELGLLLADEAPIHTAPLAEAPEGSMLEGWVKRHVQEALEAVAVPVILGGEGTVSLWGIEKVNEFIKATGHPLTVLHLDSCSDFEGGEIGQENHHTVMRRVSEIENGPKLCQVGVRSFSKSAVDRMFPQDSDKTYECFFMSDLFQAEDDSWQEDIVKEVSSPVYLSIDLSVFDPSVFPSVGSPQPGGLTWWPALRLLRRLAKERRIAAIDIVELCPREGDVIGDFTAARLAYKLMNYIFYGGKMLEKPEPAEAAVEGEADSAE